MYTGGQPGLGSLDVAAANVAPWVRLNVVLAAEASELTASVPLRAAAVPRVKHLTTPRDSLLRQHHDEFACEGSLELVDLNPRDRIVEFATNRASHLHHRAVNVGVQHVLVRAGGLCDRARRSRG